MSMGADRRFELWSGSDRRSKMFHYNFSGRTSWKGNLLIPNGIIGRYSPRIHEWLLTEVVSGGLGLTDASKCPTSTILGGPQKKRNSRFFRTFFTLLDRASFPHYNNTKIIKFG